MGNALRFLCGGCFRPPPSHDSQALGPHGVTEATVGVSALARDLLHFDVTSQVPEGLSKHVVSSKKAQANWSLMTSWTWDDLCNSAKRYRKLLEAWREAKPPPKTPEEAARLVVQTLKRHKKADVEGLLAFYGLPSLEDVPEVSIAPPAWPEGVKFELNTLPVDAKAVADGDTVTVYVDTADPRESANVPRGIHEAAIERATARAVRNYTRADALHQTIIDAGYRVINGPNDEETLARKYRIRLRGIDAPETAMPYGKEAKEELTKLIQGKRLKIYVFGDDQYDRSVGDVHCNGVFVQEQMLKRGFAWHYVAYDQRPEFASWEKEAQAARRGLWALPNPEKPWEWRKKNNRRKGV